MTGSTFPFISDPVLRQNLDESFDHIVTLLSFSESATYDDVAKSSFRKTMIIYTASIVEALLFHVVDTKLTKKDLEICTWELTNKKILYEVDDMHQIIAGDFKIKVTEIKKEKLNLAQICELLKEKGILKEPLFGKVDQIRTLRNSQHIGPTKKVKAFSKEDLENAFSIASDVKGFVKAKM